MYTTALVVQQGAQTICLYFAGRAHAGENLEALLTHREADRDKPLVMSDALAANTADEAALIRCHCLAHGRRKFSELEEVFPAECAVVIEALKQVFDHDEEARVQQLNARSAWPTINTYSGPIMEALKTWLEQQFEERLVEPNSSLGKAIAYLLDHWETLTRFLQVERRHSTTTSSERALKLVIRQRKNSLFYATELQCLHRQHAHQPHCHLPPRRGECVGVSGGVAGAPRRPSLRPSRLAAVELPRPTSPRLRPAFSNRPPSGPAADCHSRAR